MKCVFCPVTKNNQGKHKIVPSCSLPLTAAGCVDRIITELAVFDVDKQNKRLVLIEVAKDTTVEQVRAATGAAFTVKSGGPTQIQYAWSKQ
jgi:acyl CoA:acetate/3-ketoacid CoA transferase beta subunit